MDVPGVVWAVNISGDGRYVIAAYDDGTIRWHRMEDGGEVLALFPFPDRKNFVVWTPQGYHYSTPGADKALGWVTNRGWDQAAEFAPASRYPGFFEPAIIQQILPVGDIDRVLERVRGTAKLSEVKPQEEAPQQIKAHLHLMSVGISTYDNHESLQLGVCRRRRT